MAEKIMNLFSNENEKYFRFLKYLILFLATIIIVLFEYSNYKNSINAEVFYGVPKQYFYKNIISSVDFITRISLSYIFILLLPWLIYYIASQYSKKIIANIFSICTSFLFVFSNILIDSSCSLITLLIFTFILLIMLPFIYVITSINNLKRKRIRLSIIAESIGLQKNNTKNESLKNFLESKSKIIKRYYLVSYIIFVCIFIVNNFFINYKNIKTYEIVTLKTIDNNLEDDTMLVVGKYKDNAILMNIVDITDQVLTFEKGIYKFEKLDNLIFKTMKFKNVRSQPRWLYLKKKIIET